MTDTYSPIQQSPKMIQIEPTELEVVPGGTANINIHIYNPFTEIEEFEIVVSGFPANWKLNANPFTSLEGGKHKVIPYSLQIPNQTSVEENRYAYTVTVTPRQHPGQSGTATATIIIKSNFKGQIFALLDSNIFSSSPGMVTTANLYIGNPDSIIDSFNLFITGLPTDWVSLSVTKIDLPPSEQRTVFLNIHPPITVRARAEGYTFSIVITSQSGRLQSEKLDCLLNITPVYKFTARLQDPPLVSGESTHIFVENQGSLPDRYSISLKDPEEMLNFTPSATGELEIAPGDKSDYEFTAIPSSPPIAGILGFDKHIPFESEVQNSEKTSQELSGEIIVKAPVPVWAVPCLIIVAVMLCAWAFIGFLWYRSQSKTPAPGDETDLYSTAVAAATASAYPVMPVIPSSTNTPFPTISLPTATFTFVPPTFTPFPTVSPFPSATPTPTTPPFPAPNSGYIAFESNPDGLRNLYLFNTFSQLPSRLTVMAAVDTTPAGSPDGNWIAFASNRTGNYDVFIMHPDGTGMINLTNNPAGDDYYPSWSPDGSWIAFTSRRDGNQEIYLIKTDGSETRNLTNHPAEDMQASWLKNNQIAFTSNRDGNQEIYLVNSDGSNPINLTNNFANDFSPAGSNSGALILFTSNREGNQEIFSMTLNGTNPTNLTRNPAEDSQATWSGDDQWIAFTSNRTGNLDIYLMRSNGADPYNMTNSTTQDQYPAWH